VLIAQQDRVVAS